jgi:hypothetical protein
MKYCGPIRIPSIEYGAVAHGVDLEVLLKDLNEAVPHGDG